AADQAIEDSAAARRYTYRVDGLEAVADAVPLLERFKQQSALKKDEKHPANAAQIDRRARSDAELLTSLLQSEGFYDAEVEPGIGLNGEVIAVELHATAGPRYTFQSVELQGVAAAGDQAATLRD